MTDPAVVGTTRAAYSGRALVALGVGVLAVVLPAPFSLIAAVAAIAFSLRARGQLKADPALKGTSASLLGFLLGVGVLGIHSLVVLPGLMVMMPMGL